MQNTIKQLELEIELSNDVLFEITNMMTFESANHKSQYIAGFQGDIFKLEQQKAQVESSFSNPAANSETV